MASETGPNGGLNDAVQELGLLSGARADPKPMCLREQLEQFRLQDARERAALQPRNNPGAEAAGYSLCSRGVGQGQENELDRDRLLTMTILDQLRHYPRVVDPDLCSPHRGSCPARLSQLSINSHRQHHLKPYNIPWRREERVRTKSENSDAPEVPMIDPITAFPSMQLMVAAPQTFQERLLTSILRSRSLEDVRSPSVEEDLDDVSLEIQRLHVNE